MIENAVRNFLLANAGDVDVDYFKADASTVPIPFITMQLENTDVSRVVGGTGITSVEFEVNCYGAHADEAITIARVLVSAIDGYKGLMGSTVWVTLARVVNQFDNDEPQSGSFVRTFTLIVNYTIVGE